MWVRSRKKRRGKKGGESRGKEGVEGREEQG